MLSVLAACQDLCTTAFITQRAPMTRQGPASRPITWSYGGPPMSCSPKWTSERHRQETTFHLQETPTGRLEDFVYELAWLVAMYWYIQLSKVSAATHSTSVTVWRVSEKDTCNMIQRFLQEWMYRLTNSPMILFQHYLLIILCQWHRFISTTRHLGSLTKSKCGSFK